MCQCNDTSYLTVFTSHKFVNSGIEDSSDKHILMDLAARVARLPNSSRTEPVKLFQAMLSDLTLVLFLHPVLRK